MSLHPQSIPDVPETTVATTRAAFPNGDRYMTMRDELGVFYADEDFTPCFLAGGSPLRHLGVWHWSWSSNLLRGFPMNKRPKRCEAGSTGSML
jgi:hypothetical protein